MKDLTELCARIPFLCRLAEVPDIRAALDDALCGDPSALTALRCALDAHGQPAADPAWLGLCRQSSPAELLSILTRCTVCPTAEGMALLVAAHREEQARTLYGLQLLWRLLGEDHLPDAFSLFQPPASAPDGEGIRRRIIDHLKGGLHDQVDHRTAPDRAGEAACGRPAVSPDHPDGDAPN